MFEPEAPNFKDIKKWFNSNPKSIKQYHGKVILLDFFTYSCINCINMLPHIKMLYEKYKNRGLEVIGIQTPEFDFEKDNENIQRAIEKYGLKYPILNDYLNTTWKLYGNKYWPRRILVNGRGKIILQQIGEGGEHELELEIIKALHEIGEKGEFTIEKKHFFTKNDKSNFLKYRSKLTPKIYMGWEKCKNFGNSNFIPKKSINFIDNYEKENKIYLNGNWIQEKDNIRKTNDEKGHIRLIYSAKKVNVIFSSLFGKKYRVYVYINNQSLDRTNAGKDIKIDQSGSYLIIDKSGTYDVIETNEMESNELKLFSNSNDFIIYSIDFK